MLILVAQLYYNYILVIEEAFLVLDAFPVFNTLMDHARRRRYQYTPLGQGILTYLYIYIQPVQF